MSYIDKMLEEISEGAAENKPSGGPYQLCVVGVGDQQYSRWR
ncbi:hypothetical protein ACFRU3_39850 [Streptomyces sp. NPDC056910]